MTTGGASTTWQALASARVGRFQYMRGEYESAALRASNTFGVLTPVGVDAVRGSLYFLHGGDGTDEQWLQAGLEACLGDALVQQLVQQGIQVVLPNIGLSFLRAPDDPAAPSHFAALCKELQPMLEAGTTTTSASRWITGISMGGCAALSVFLRCPTVFAGCSTLFPGLVDFDPFDDVALRAYAERTRISDTHRDILGQCFRSAFASAGEWQRHDPLVLAECIDPLLLRGRPLHVEVGSADEFGLQVGVAALAEVFAARGVTCGVTVIEGGRHDAALLQQRIDPLWSALLTA